MNLNSKVQCGKGRSISRKDDPFLLFETWKSEWKEGSWLRTVPLEVSEIVKLHHIP